MSGVDLVQWLTAQLDADERIVRAAVDDLGGPALGSEWNYDGQYVVTKQEQTLVAVGSQDWMSVEVGRYIAAHDPARVLREIEAKRGQVEWCVEVIGDRDLSRYDKVGALKDDKDALAVTLAVETLRLLAQPYDARPGYLAKWAPSE